MSTVIAPFEAPFVTVAPTPLERRAELEKPLLWVADQADDVFDMLRPIAFPGDDPTASEEPLRFTQTIGRLGQTVEEKLFISLGTNRELMIQAVRSQCSQEPFVRKFRRSQMIAPLLREVTEVQERREPRTQFDGGKMTISSTHYRFPHEAGVQGYEVSRPCNFHTGLRNAERHIAALQRDLALAVDLYAVVH